MRLDKNTILDLLRNQGKADKVPEADRQLPDQVDTDDEGIRGVLAGLGIDISMVEGLIDKLPVDKLPGGVADKVRGGLGKLL